MREKKFFEKKKLPLDLKFPLLSLMYSIFSLARDTHNISLEDREE